MAKLVGEEMVIGVPRTEEDAAERSAPVVLAMDEDESLVLQLADLVPDDAGEVALRAADMTVSLLTDAPLLDAGIANTHVTASGVDVTGHRLYRFGNGITVYSPDVLRITQL